MIYLITNAKVWLQAGPAPEHVCLLKVPLAEHSGVVTACGAECLGPEPSAYGVDARLGSGGPVYVERGYWNKVAGDQQC